MQNFGGNKNCDSARTCPIFLTRSWIDDDHAETSGILKGTEDKIGKLMGECQFYEGSLTRNCCSYAVCDGWMDERGMLLVSRGFSFMSFGSTANWSGVNGRGKI